MDEKKLTVGEETDDLGKVIKNLIDYDAKQRAVVSESLKKREEEKKSLAALKDEINAEYIRRADERLARLEKAENENAEKRIRAAKAAADKNIAEFDRTAESKTAEWVEQLYIRTLE